MSSSSKAYPVYDGCPFSVHMYCSSVIMFLSECITFSVNTTVHGSYLEQSVKQLQVFPALYMDLSLLLLICCLL